jgi:ribonucleoside-diphosphate reductase alpha chain
MYAWKKWLKSTYYCFIEKNIQWEKYTESVNKRGGRVWFGGPTTPAEGTTPPARWFGFAAATSTAIHAVTTDYRSFDAKNITPEQKAIMEQQMRAEKWDEYVEKLKAGTLYGDSCPVDPFEKVMCDGCQ